MYGIPQSGIIANGTLKNYSEKNGYQPAKIHPSTMDPNI